MVTQPWWPRAFRDGRRCSSRLYGFRGFRYLSLPLVLRQSHAGRVSSSEGFSPHVLPRRGAPAATRSRRELWLRSEPARLQLPRSLPGPSTSSTALPHCSSLPLSPPPPGSRTPWTPHSTPHFPPSLRPSSAYTSPCHLQPGSSRGGAHGPLLQALCASPAPGGRDCSALGRSDALQAEKGRAGGVRVGVPIGE